jgi:NitT/TauT family transport system ATP-binding protein
MVHSITAGAPLAEVARLTTRTTTGITLDIAEKRYSAEAGHSAVIAIRDLRAHIAPNEFCVLFGPSGCGKSSLLNIIAGIDRSFSGSVRFDGESAPRIGYVFQAPRLLPWRTVRQNLELVLPPGVDPARVDDLLAEVGLAAVAQFYPSRLSGGMARRAALARAFAINPDLLLLDEPFVSLDAAAAARLRALMLRLLATQPATVLFVTHDAAEAAMLADRILLLSSAPGRVLAEMPIPMPREQRRGQDTIAALAAELVDLSRRLFSIDPRSAPAAPGEETAVF